MAFCELAHDLLDPCRKAQMPCKLTLQNRRS
jgi:hypothetical protein